jgi:nucleoid DNA-binding protein
MVALRHFGALSVHRRNERMSCVVGTLQEAIEDREI